MPEQNFTGPLETGVTRIVDPTTQDELGYVYTEISGAGQLQRWMLYRNPQNSLETQAAPPSMSNFTLADWQQFVTQNWQPDYFYIRAQTTVYLQGQTYDGVTWTHIPPSLPSPVYPSGFSDYQLDFTLVALEVFRDKWRGRVYAEGIITEPSSKEYWSLPSGFLPAGKTAQLRVGAGEGSTPTRDAFIALANETFGPGSAFVITGCVNYQGAAPPGIL